MLKLPLPPQTGPDDHQEDQLEPFEGSLHTAPKGIVLDGQPAPQVSAGHDASQIEDQNDKGIRRARSDQPTAPKSQLLEKNDDRAELQQSAREVPEIVLRRFQGLSFMVPMRVGDIPVEAIVDSAAQVTVLSEQLFKQMNMEVCTPTKATLRGIGVGERLDALKVPDVKLSIGGTTYNWEVFVANIKDPLLLGLDFLLAKECKMDFSKGTLTLPTGTVMAVVQKDKTGEGGTSTPVVNRKRVVLQPRSVTRIPVRLCTAVELGQYVIIEHSEPQTGVMQNPIITLSENPVVQVINLTDRCITVRKGEEMGNASEGSDILTLPESGDDVQDITTVPSVLQLMTTQEGEVLVETTLDSYGDVSTSPEEPLRDWTKEVPVFLQEMYQSSVKHLSPAEGTSLAKLLIDYQDVFSKHDLDLGCLTAVKHRIDTQAEAPVRQRMRRTPLGFEKEEKEHLDKMLAAGAIRPSSSEWASAPVLVRKKDGSVRWLYRVRTRKKDHVWHHDKLKICRNKEIPIWLRRARHTLLRTEAPLASETQEPATQANEGPVEVKSQASSVGERPQKKRREEKGKDGDESCQEAEEEQLSELSVEEAVASMEAGRALDQDKAQNNKISGEVVTAPGHSDNSLPPGPNAAKEKKITSDHGQRTRKRPVRLEDYVTSL